MPNKQSPLQVVKEKFGSKEKLVAKVVGLIEKPEDESDEEFSERLLRAANAKLLHLLTVGERVKELGGRDAISKKIAELRGHAKDADYLASLKGHTLGSLLDMLSTGVPNKRRKKKSA